ncbi:site-specific integrase [Aminobacter sp. LjRoot7]|uniref:site-specific integrase n=1 Tax=Aminobacter sp. LjRoot7 TaxID=3342335 RepID=UPI003F4FCE72
MVELHNFSATRAARGDFPPTRIIESSEEASLFAAIRLRSELYFDLSVFLLDTGARISEAAALQWPAIDKQSVTFVESKSALGRTIPLTARAATILSRRRLSTGGPFSSVSLGDYRTVWNSARQEAEISDPGLSPMSLRHTCAVRLVRGGINLQTVQTWLGLRSLAMTMRYAQYADTGSLESCVQALERTRSSPEG